MSNAEAEDRATAVKLPDEYIRLERSIHRLLDEMAGYRARAQVAEQKATELEQTLREVSTGGLDPVKLQDGLRRLEQENRDLRSRIVQAQERIRRLVARFDFLGEEL